jgi:ABC-type transporter Mla MlaB component
VTAPVPASGDVIYDDGILRISRIHPPRAGLVLAGEADESGYKPLVTALAQLASSDGSGPAEVHLDLSGLEFCDAAALHAMIAPAEERHRQIVLHHPPAPLQALIRIAGWDELPGLEVVTGQ